MPAEKVNTEFYYLRIVYSLSFSVDSIIIWQSNMSDYMLNLDNHSLHFFYDLHDVQR